MNILTVHRAADADRAAINITDPISEVTGLPGQPPSVMALSHLITFEGDAIADALFNSLPQATGNRVMARLMERYATMYLGGPRK